MLIVNDSQLRRASIASLGEQCVYCSQPLAAYPLVMGDDTKQTVYHVTCALELATDLLVDLATFFHLPAPYPPLSVLTPSEIGRGSEERGMSHAMVNRCPSD